LKALRRSVLALLVAVALLAAAPAADGSAESTPSAVGLEVLSGPHGRTNRHYATFRFTANPAVYHFTCQLDERPQRPCSSPVTFRHLSSGTHYLQIGAEVRLESGGEAAAELLRWTIK
jgi:hypothetical protein